MMKIVILISFVFLLKSIECKESYLRQKPCGKSKAILYKEDELSNRMVEIVFLDNKISDCFIYGNKSLAESFIQRKMCKPVVINVKKQIMSDMALKCSKWLLLQMKIGKIVQYSDKDFPDQFNNKIDRNFYDGILIYPGTKWCGAGNTSENYDDLGTEIETDQCCRTHDFCFDSIIPGETKYNLTNKAIHTKSHCDCDQEFRECLLNVKKQTAKKLATLFFNLIQVQCFKKDFPIVECLEYKGIPFFWKSCQKYALDYNQETLYQFFDAIFVN